MALSVLHWSYTVPKTIEVIVEKGWVTLQGIADWEFQRSSALKAIKQLMGVRGVTNNIVIKSNIKSNEIKTDIEDAIKRTSDEKESHVKVNIDGELVTLSGHVQSFRNMKDAEIAAWNAPGVMMVKNEITIL